MTTDSKPVMIAYKRKGTGFTVTAEAGSRADRKMAASEKNYICQNPQDRPKPKEDKPPDTQPAVKK